AGSVDYIGPGRWGELYDEQVRGVHKGWLLADLDSGKVTPKQVPTARTVYDAIPIEADGLSAAEVDRQIGERLAKVPKGYEDAIVRIRIRDIPRHISRELDHAALRQYKANALHLQIAFYPPEASRSMG